MAQSPLLSHRSTALLFRMRILIIDDDAEAVELLSHYLSPLGDVFTAPDGQRGVEAVRGALVDREPFHLVTLDLRMQGMGGQQTLLAIRRLEAASGVRPAERARILMTTASGERMHVERALAGGCDGYLLKPFTKDELLARVEAVGIDVGGALGSSQTPSSAAT
jgi:two-component system chemotaxis response regulator CheY